MLLEIAVVLFVSELVGSVALSVVGLSAAALVVVAVVVAAAAAVVVAVVVAGPADWLTGDNIVFDLAT